MIHELWITRLYADRVLWTWVIPTGIVIMTVKSVTNPKWAITSAVVRAFRVPAACIFVTCVLISRTFIDIFIRVRRTPSKLKANGIQKIYHNFFELRGRRSYAILWNRMNASDWLIARKTITLKRSRCINTDGVFRKIEWNIFDAFWNRPWWTDGARTVTV